MRANIGLKSNVDKKVLKNLKDGDVLYSAVYDHASGYTTPEAYVFRGYAKAPNSQKGIWAKIVSVAYYDSEGKLFTNKREHKDEKGNVTEVEDIKVNDISVGLFSSKLDALEAWCKVAEQIYKSAKDALEKEQKENEK